MHAILAENLDGWLYAAAAFFGGLLASVLALAALFPAWQRNRALTWTLAAPALAVGLLATLWMGYGFVTTSGGAGVGDLTYFVVPWLMMAGPPWGTGLLAVLVLRSRMKSLDP